MYSKEQNKRIISVVSNILIWLFEVGSFAFVWYGNFYKGNHFYIKGNIAVIGIYAVFIFLITKNLNGYKNSYMRVVDLCLSNMLAILLGIGTGYVLACMVMRKYVNKFIFVKLWLVQMVFVVACILICRYIYLNLFPPRKVVIIYGNYPLEGFLKKFNTRNDKYEVCEILNYQRGYEKICSDVLDFEGVILYDLPAEDRNHIMKYCYEHSIRTYVVPKITDIIMRGAEDLHLVDTPIYLSRNQGLKIDQRFVKRLMDIFVSALGIIILLPVMLIIAVLIKLYDGGPVLYKQVRLTRDGKEFTIYKFRSMKIDAEASGAQLARKMDSRITPVGRVLRNLHLDELPQLFNVFKGDMSIVGPRPERPEIFEKYEADIPEFRFRLKVKAGLTGYAQVYGKYNTKPIDKLKMDLTYIQEFSYLLDIRLMIMTLKIIFQKENSEGIDSNQKTALEEKKR